MRFSYFVAVALTGLLACSEAVVATDGDKTIKSETTRGQVLSDRELIDTGVNDNEKRFLRRYTEAEDDSDDSKVAKTETNSEDSREERFSLIQMSNQPRYYLWFKDEMTPKDVRRELGLTRNSIKLVKRSIYKGYVKYYDQHCTYFNNRKKDFCLAQEY